MNLLFPRLLLFGMLCMSIVGCTKTGDLGFHVTDASSGQAIQGAFVGLANDLDAIDEQRYFQTGYTQADGRIVFGNIEEGEYAYTVRVEFGPYNFRSAVNFTFEGENVTVAAPVTN